MGIELTNDQAMAVLGLEHWWNSRDRQLFEISGRPGTGKSFLIKYFIDRIGLKLNEVLFVAYMGKAASVLARNGLPGQTIHSAIYDYVPYIVRDDNNKIVFSSAGKPKKGFKFELKPRLPKKIKLIVVDEGSFVDPTVAKDLLSFNVPIVVLGDLNQLPPVFGKPFFLNHPDVVLNQIMRQAKDSPIVYLCNELLEGHELKYGVYGSSAVIRKQDMTEYQWKNADIVLTGTNRLRYHVNNFYREKIYQIEKLDYPHVNEKVICRKNNWDMSIDNGIYLTNGTTGFVDYIHRDTFNGKTMEMDFRPDFTKSVFRNIKFDYAHMYSNPSNNGEDENPFGYFYDKMEFAYAITTHSSQGSQWPSVLYFDEEFMPKDKMVNLRYTAISRASENIIIVR